MRVQFGSLHRTLLLLAFTGSLVAVSVGTSATAHAYACAAGPTNRDGDCSSVCDADYCGRYAGECLDDGGLPSLRSERDGDVCCITPSVQPR